MSRMRVWCALSLALGTFLLSGCSSPEGKMTAQEKVNFRGGKPSPEQAAEMAKFFAREAEKNKAKKDAPPAPPTTR